MLGAMTGSIYTKKLVGAFISRESVFQFLVFQLYVVHYWPNLLDKKGQDLEFQRNALQRQNTKISKQIFPDKEYRGLSPNFHIHACVSDLYIPTIFLPILLEEICRPILGLNKSLTDTWMLKLGLRPRYSQKRNT